LRLRAHPPSHRLNATREGSPVVSGRQDESRLSFRRRCPCDRPGIRPVIPRPAGHRRRRSQSWLIAQTRLGQRTGFTRLQDGHSTAHGPGRAVEGGDYTVAGRVHLVTSMALKLSIDHMAMAVE